MPAEDTQWRAQQATEAAQRLTDEVRARKSDLDKRIAEVKQALGRLSQADRADLARVKDNGVYLGPPGAAGDALQAALSRRGAEYEWAAVGPWEFDCSGLTMWAYKQAGINLPHSSRSQFTLSRAVSINELRPGDLVFYDDGAGNPDEARPRLRAPETGQRDGDQPADRGRGRQVKRPAVPRRRTGAGTPVRRSGRHRGAAGTATYRLEVDSAQRRLAWRWSTRRR